MNADVVIIPRTEYRRLIEAETRLNLLSDLMVADRYMPTETIYRLIGTDEAIEVINKDADRPCPAKEVLSDY